VSEQPATKSGTRGTNKATQAAAGVAGALAFLGIGWVMGARSAPAPQAPGQAAAGSAALPVVRVPGEWDDEQNQWGTIPLPGNVVPAQPGTGGIAPPATGSGGSSVAGASITTTNATTTVPTTPSTGTAPTTGGAP
jgi:hypothetical protein